MKKRIAIIANFSYSSSVPERIRYEQPEAFNKAYSQFVKESNFVIYRYYLIFNRLTSLRSASLISIIYLPALIYRLVKNGFDLIKCGLESPWDLCAFIMGKLMRTPVIVGDNHWYWPNTLPAKLYFPIARLIAKHGTLLSVTKKSAEFWKLSGVPTEKMRLITPPDYVPKLEVSDVDILKAEELKKKLGLENKKVILYFGRLIRKKGVEYLIKAFKRVSKEYENSFLVIAGDGPERKRLEDLCRELDIHNVYFSGFVKADEKNAYFYLCDIFVYPSITLDIPEEWSLGVCEAMSLGKPVIVTKAVGSVNELVFHKYNGYVVPERDDEAIYEAIKCLLTDDELRTKIGKNAKRTVEMGFAYEKLFNRLREVIEEGLSLKLK